MSDTSVTTEAPLANSSEARTPSGEIKDVQTQTSTPTDQQATDTKSTTTESGDGKTETKETKTETGAPEKYADFKLPEGIKLDGDQLTAATTLFKESGLTQEAAQKMVDFHVAQLKASGEAPMKAYNDLRQSWRDEVVKEFGPLDGAKIKTVKENYSRVLNAVGDQTLANNVRQAMDVSGLGDHPAMLSLFNKLAEFVTEGRHVAGAQPSKHGQTAPNTNERPDAAHSLYPNNP